MTQNIATVILAGGQGQRMGGQDKGLLQVGGETLVTQVIKQVTKDSDYLLISANRNISEYQSFGYPVVQDAVCDANVSEEAPYQGPIAGILSAYHHLTSLSINYSALAIVPCDTPQIPSNLIARLSQNLSADLDIVIAHDGQRRQNLHCLVARPALSSLEEYFAQGGRALHQWFGQISLIEVDFSAQKERFLNINRPIES